MIQPLEKACLEWLKVCKVCTKRHQYETNPQGHLELNFRHPEGHDGCAVGDLTCVQFVAFWCLPMNNLSSLAVVDFCLTKEMVCDRNTSFCSLRPTWASKASCDQRKGSSVDSTRARVHVLEMFCSENLIPDILTVTMNSVVSAELLVIFERSSNPINGDLLSGRVGRVQAGRCYRLVSRDFFRDCIQQYNTPQMLVS